MIRCTPRAVRDLESPEPAIANRVRNAIERLAATGEGGLKALHGPLRGLFRLRCGD